MATGFTIAERRFVVRYTPAAKVLAAARKNGWTPESGESLLDAVGDHFSFEETDSVHASVENAVKRAQELIHKGRDLFGQTSVHEEEYRLIVPEDNYSDWEIVTRHNVDETGVIESIREECDA
jgi:hypothetical protein